MLKDTSSIGMLCSALINLSELKELELSFGRSVMNSKGIEALNATLQKLTKLENLALNFTKNFNITNKDIGLLVRPVKKMTKLTKLSL